MKRLNFQCPHALVKTTRWNDASFVIEGENIVKNATELSITCIMLILDLIKTMNIPSLLDS